MGEKEQEKTGGQAGVGGEATGSWYLPEQDEGDDKEEDDTSGS
jgi:hypothetical protein